MSSRSIAIAGMRSEDTSYCVARSSSNRRLLWILVAATLAAQAGIQLICRQISLSLWTLLLGVFVIRQALNTYVRATILGHAGIVHRTALGRVVAAPYSELSVLEAAGTAVVILAGAREITFRERDTDLSRLSELLRKKVPRYTLIN